MTLLFVTVILFLISTHKQRFTLLERKPGHSWWGEQTNRVEQVLEPGKDFLTGFTRRP